jgi:spermidine synthase
MSKEGLIYFEDGELLAEHNTARVYKMNGDLFLEIGKGHTLWALENEIEDYIEQLYDYPKGNCLEIGLGLGVASRYILTFPKVEHLTTIEVNKDVIDVHKKIKESDRGRQFDYNSSRHRILNADGISYAYQTKQKYDFIFIDCYDRIDEETLPMIADMASACSRVLQPGGRMVGWTDKHTPAIYYNIFKKIFEFY